MQGLLACSTMLPTLGIVVVGLRFYARSTQKAKLKIDDWLQIPSLVSHESHPEDKIFDMLSYFFLGRRYLPFTVSDKFKCWFQFQQF